MNISRTVFKEISQLRCQRHWPEVERFDARIARTSFATHAHEGFVVGIVLTGVQSFIHRGVDHAVPAGSITFLNPGELSSAGALQGHSVQYQTLHVPAQALESLAPAGFRFPTPVLYNHSIARRLSEQLAILDATREKAVWHARLTEFLHQCTGLFISRETPEPEIEDARITAIRSYIEDNLVSSLELEALSQQIELSKFHFLRLFRAHVGVTPHVYIQARRTARAKMLLRQHSPAQVAALCGFVDQSHLTRWIRSCYGTTPSVYHKQFRSLSKLA